MPDNADVEEQTLVVVGTGKVGTAMACLLASRGFRPVALADPDAGLRALRGVLKPDGAMHLMLYAPYGRTGIYMLQEFCRRIGIHATDEGIRDLIAALKALPPGHPLEHLLREAPDFRHERPSRQR